LKIYDTRLIKLLRSIILIIKLETNFVLQLIFFLKEK